MISQDIKHTHTHIHMRLQLFSKEDTKNLKWRRYTPLSYIKLALVCVCVCMCVCVCVSVCVCLRALSRSVISNSLGPMDSSLPDSSVHGIFKARILEWFAFPTPDNLRNSGIKPLSPVSCTGWQILYHWTTWKAPKKPLLPAQWTDIEENELFEEFQQLWS